MNVEIEFEPIIFTEKLINLVENANERVVISALYIQNDEAGNNLLDLLSCLVKQKPHISLDVYLDGIYNTDWIFDKYSTLKNNIHIVKLNKFLPLRVFHIKGWVVDDKLIYSGININNRYLPKNNSFRLDRYFFIESKMLCDLHDRALKEIKNQSKSRVWKAVSVENYYLSNGDFTISPFYSFNKNGLQSKIVYEVCRLAKKEIFFSTPYFNLTKELKDIFRDLLKKGVTINIVVGVNNGNKKNYNDRLRSNKLITAFYSDLLFAFMQEFDNEINKNIFIYQWEDADNSYHYKSILIDNNITLLTSSNYNRRSEYLDYENGFLFKAKSLQYKNLLIKEKEKILEKTTLIPSIKEIDLTLPKKYALLISSLKFFRLYNKAIGLI